ncbi:hypothetical protein L1987_86526 [Smallanthus sonchifolius]|uniref:Uncharacterized protein n=1 Tax=Smallanthus sonchifolius TaxID=185202 RepID=A0ACB8Y0M5_9ASTR|nr:hypothetical protein L1987_86526 [Smallanthus sonchifolius]
MDKLQWGNRKRLRCVKVKESDGNGNVVQKKIASQRVDRTVVNEQDSHHPLPSLHSSSPQRLNRKITSALSSPEKEDRYYTTRGSTGVGFDESSSSKKVIAMESKKESKKTVWPRLFTTLSNKEKEEDFMAMKGCKLPQRPKKRAKMIQRTLLLVSPGAWLSDLCQERYEVREEKTSKKRPRGLKAMGSIESDSE